MASGINKVLLIGRLGTNPEVRYTTNGGAVANFNLATNESWTDKAGQKQAQGGCLGKNGRAVWPIPN